MMVAVPPEMIDRIFLWLDEDSERFAFCVSEPEILTIAQGLHLLSEHGKKRVRDNAAAMTARLLEMVDTQRSRSVQ